MLPAAHRLTSPDQFRTTVRRGRRRGGATMVVHLLSEPADASSTRVGFVVAKSVGGAVTRNQVKRRLRHLCRERLPMVPAGSWLVVRALPPAGSAPSTVLGRDLDRCLSALSTPRRVGAGR